jgi:hypothetical protein
VGQLARRVEQRKVFLVGLHREDEALLRHGEKGRIELAQQHVRALDQGSNFVEQRGIVDGVQAGPACRAVACSCAEISARRASKLAITAPSSRS